MLCRPWRSTPSEISIILQLMRKPNSIIVLLFIKQAKTGLPQSMTSSSSITCLSGSLADKGLFSTANILQIVDVVRRVVFLLFLLCF